VTKPVAAPTKYAIAPNGEIVAQTDEQALAGQENGYEAADGNQYRRQLQAAASEKYVDEHWGTAGKAAAGVASGLTLGLAPSFASRMGLVDRDNLEAAEQSGAFTAGDVAGMVAPAVLSGGESLAARGLAQGGARGLGKVALALTPAGLMGEAGGIAERVAGKILTDAGIMGRLASPTLRLAARGATEGAINNVAHTAAEQVIQNKPLAAEALLISGADGAMFGGLIGGVLGGATAAAGAGIDLVGGRVAGLGGAGGRDVAAAKALKYLGASDENLARIAGSEGGLQGTIRNLKDVLEKGEGSVGAGVANVRRAAKVAQEGYSEGILDSVRTLQKDHPDLVPRIERVGARMDQELTTQFGGMIDAREVGGLNKQLQRSMRNVKSWEGWSKTRESLATKLDGMAEGTVRKEVFKTALNIVDDEMVGESSALMAMNPDLAKKYAANVVGKRAAGEFMEMTATKAVAPPPNPLNVHGAAGTIAYGAIAGANPVVGAGIIAAKQMVGKLQQSLAAPMAEAAYRSALGAQAQSATINMGNRITSGVKKFLGAAPAAARGQHAESHAASTKPSYTMENFKRSLELADALTSQGHQNKVREITEALALQGHPEVAKEMAETYGRAVAYISANRPKKGLPAHAAGKLGKIPAAMGLSTQDMKFIRQIHTMRDPMGAIVGGLERGDISRDAVATWQHVFPAAAADLNMRVAQELVEYRSEGKFVPADKVAMIGTVLNYPVDSKLEPDFINEVQAGLAANKAPTPEQGEAQAPTTDISAYQTPLQNSIG
jgi:hypothetical protein